MQRDIRGTPLYQQALALYEQARQPGSGRPNDALEIDIAPDGHSLIFTAISTDADLAPTPRICELHLETRGAIVLTSGPNADRSPKYSPDGAQIAFLSDRKRKQDFQLHLLDRANGQVCAAPEVNGWAEYLHWSPNGRRILLGVARHGADIAGAQGAIRSRPAHDDLPAWTPDVWLPDDMRDQRRVWVYDTRSGELFPIAPPNLNVWEAAWCGEDAVVAIVSGDARESAWYSASVARIEIKSGALKTLYIPRHQVARVAASPSGDCVAFVEAVSSDRFLVAGEVCLIEPATGDIRRIECCGADITHLEWRSESTLLFAGHRRSATVVGRYNRHQNISKETWASSEITAGGIYATVAGIGEEGHFALVSENFLRAPEIGVVEAGVYRGVISFDLGYGVLAKAIRSVEPLTWQAGDGVELDGWVLWPRASGPRPLVVALHGGPVWQWRPSWLTRRNAYMLQAVLRGYAVFLPNPRGSSGRGQSFASMVVGDMGGADAGDIVSGIDSLIAKKLVDPQAIGVTGVSYGGFLTASLISQHPKMFAAAVPVAPMINYVTQQLLSNIPDFVSMFLQDRYTNLSGAHYTRSPITQVHRVQTPVLNICGALDRSAPPSESEQYHRALNEHGITSVLVSYPFEGHGIQGAHASIDYASRLLGWFEQYIPSDASGTSR